MSDLKCVSTVIVQSERLLRDDRGEKCFPRDHYRKQNQSSGDMMDYLINYHGEQQQQRCRPRCRLGPAEAEHLSQKGTAASA